MGVRENVLPPAVAKLTGAFDRAKFRQYYGHDLLMLVGIEGEGSELHLELERCAQADGETWYPRTEGTATSLATGMSLPQLRERLDSLPEPFGGNQLREQLAQRKFFVVPVCKRPGAMESDAERISIGRSRRNDIVLAHKSISKVHAYLEHDERERLYLADAGSTNFTRVRGRIVDPDTTVTFSLGDPVQLGDVEVLIVDPDMVWDALQDG